MPAVAQYDPVAKGLHWTIVLLLIVQFISAWIMPEGFGIVDFQTLINVHMSFGAAILVLMIVRLLWRLTHPAPENDAHSPQWQRIAAKLTQYGLYGLLVILPILGWAWASSLGFAVRIFGVITLPAIVPEGSSAGRIAGMFHSDLAVVLLALAGLHIAAALYHRYFLKDAVLASMMPRGWSK